ncbi:NAD-dependent epimerase/dehydratase family protein [Micromonospora sp. SH-82]|uniref:NAD-dependent epimerase/dehydratase family protein n=1 Tax=Micromonospora sp. SH-82 TaxID=3132938 RepID=UPI003EBD3833
MRLLVLGGTRFVGHAVVATALELGWEVTTFNRGRAGDDLAGVDARRGDRSRPDDVAMLASTGRWDAVVDTSGYVPRNTLDVAGALAHVVDRYVFLSTVSVYRDWPAEPLTEESPILACPADAGEDHGTDTEDGPTRYGYQKSGCENAVRLAFGEHRTTVLRPGVILGPREYVGRLPWWLHRIASGGPVLVPAPPRRSIQPVDVRDLAAFALQMIIDERSGCYNVCAPIGRSTFADLVSSCAEVTGGRPDFTWLPDDVLTSAGVRQWSELPLWRTHPGVWQVDATRAARVGLACRPLVDTVLDTWRWLIDSNPTNAHERSMEIGLDRRKEAQILAAWARSSGSAS